MAGDADKHDELRPEVFEDYDAFVKEAVREFYDRGWKNRRGSFIALVIASGQMASMAVDSVRSGSGLKKAAIGAAGVVALRFGLRYVASGPLGIVLTGVAAASAISYMLKNKTEITGKVGTYRQMIQDYRARFDEIQGGYRAGRYDAAGRNLMVDGLLKRFLADIENAP